MATKLLLLFTVVTLAAPQSFAQQSDVVIQSLPQVQTPIQQPVQQPVYMVQKQPTTIVEDAPYKESRADQMRRQRIEAEQATETRIVEKLESERMQEEQERSRRFMEKLEGVGSSSHVSSGPTVEVAPQDNVVTVAPAAPAPVLDVTHEIDVVKKKKKDTYFATGIVGFSDYGSAVNMETAASFGATMGMVFDRRFKFGATFLFSRFDIECVQSWNSSTCQNLVGGSPYLPAYERMDQYSISADLDMILKAGHRIKPTLGVSVGYTNRNYYPLQGMSWGPSLDQDTSSWSFDLGLAAGAEVLLSRDFTLGFKWKWMNPVLYEVPDTLKQSIIYQYGWDQPVEETSYSSYLFTATYVF